MSNIKKISLLFLALALLAGANPSDLSARVRKKAKVENVEKPAPKKTPYQKFVEKKGVEKGEGFVNIYKSGKNIFLEIPDSLIGRRVLLTTHIKESRDVNMPEGLNISPSCIYFIDKTDSLVLFRKPADIVKAEEDGMKPSVFSGREPVVYALPIKYRNADSSAVVVNADKIFDPADKKVVSMRGFSYGDGIVIYDWAFKSEFSRFLGICSFGESVAVVRETAFELSLVVSAFGLECAEKPISNLTTQTSITLLPETPTVLRKADSRIGTRNVSCTLYSSVSGTKSEQLATRWNLVPKDAEAYFRGEGSDVENPIRIYVDTLFNASWQKAIKEGILAWEPAFDAIGLRNALVVEPYPSDGSFSACNPLSSVISFVGGADMGIYSTLLRDNGKAGILACRICVPGDYVAGVHRRSVYSICDVDERYASYFLPEEAVCEVLRADVMRQFGLCLGLRQNYAGSFAYSPEQLRDPEFTRANGITASVTDDVLFNYLCRPGDKERGVATIVDQIGAYDKLAIQWLYSLYPEKEEAALDALLSSVDGKAEYLYLPYADVVVDPRGVAKDLGNDVFAAFDAGMSHLRHVVAIGDKLLSDDDIPQSYRALFIEWAWLRFRDLSTMLSAYTGGVVSNSMESGKPKLEAFPQETQRRAMKTLLEAYLDAGWIDENRAFLHTSGPYESASRFTYSNAFNLSGLRARLPVVIMACEEAGSEYKPETFLSDMQEILFRDISKGKIKSDGSFTTVMRYIGWLISSSDVTKANYAAAKSKGGSACFAEEESISVRIAKVPAKYYEEVGNLCYESLLSARGKITRGISLCTDSYDKSQLEFLLSTIDAALGKK